MHSIGEAMGVHAQHIDALWHAMLWVCGLMYVLVLAFLVLAIFRRGRRRDDSSHPALRHPGESRDLIGRRAECGPDLRRDDGGSIQAQQERGLSVTLMAWTALILAGLFGLTLFSYFTDRSLVQAASQSQINLKITGHQWWWQIEYVDRDPSRSVKTANEIHLPVGAQVSAALSSQDVIHSFWVPNLHGKRDLIPGRDNDIRLQPMKEGTYRGICAEFCGLQHSKMHLEVIVESQDAYDAWYEQQLQTPPPPSDALAQRGQQVFMSSACNLCHAISGTDASASVAPDLSHVASRRMLAAGALPNDPDKLLAWIANPQAIKPGNHMPVVPLSAEQLEALTAYLRTLQ